MITETLTKNPDQAKDFFEHKMAFTTGPVDVSHKIKDKADINVVDVRAQEDYKAGHVPGAVNLPQEKWDTLDGLNKDKVNVLYCYSQTCHLAARAAVKFAGKGYSVMEMDGGFEGWKENHLEIAT